ncbi:MAG: alpha/beta hydrolase-fold protein [Rhizobiaceae bacterium]
MEIKSSSRWHSDRVGQEVTLVRWGHWGQPVLLFPTAGGDAEEVDRMGVIGAIWPMIETGRIKVYSCDSVAGKALTEKRGSVEYRCRLLNGFEEFVAWEVIPAIRADCKNEEAEVIAAGASIGAFNAVAVACRYPDLFRAAIGMSGTFDIEGLLGFKGTEDFYFASPLLFLPGLEGALLDRLRRRFVLMAYGEGRWENPSEAWRMAEVLGGKGVPNRVDVWGREWDHDWNTWRHMVPKYLSELVPE